MIFCFLAWFLGLMYTLMKGKWLNFIGTAFFTPDLLTILIAYLFLFYSQPVTGTFAFFQGLLIDLFSGGLHGLYAALYLSVYGGIYLGSRFFDLQHPQGQFILAGMAVLLKQALFFLGLTIFSYHMTSPDAFIGSSFASAVLTGVSAPIAFYLFDWLRNAPVHESHKSLSGELEEFKREALSDGKLLTGSRDS